MTTNIEHEHPGQQADAQTGGSFGAMDAHRIRHKSQLVKIACDIAAVAQRYKKIHHTLFGFSVRRVLHALQTNRLTDYETLELELDSIVAETKCIQQAIDNIGLCDLPKHANTIIAMHNTLEKYAEAVSDVTLQLNRICRNLRCESTVEAGFKGYSDSQFQHEKAAYDACVQEFRRRGTQLTELFEKF